MSPASVCGDGERDREQGYAHPVVEAALDVQPLADARGEVLVGDDGLTERRIGGCQHDRQDGRLGPRHVVEDDAGGEGAGDDRQRKTDAEQAGRHRVLPSQHP